MQIKPITNFDETDSVQQLIVLQNAENLLEYLKKENENFPVEAYEKGVEALKKAWGFIDDEIIHGGY